MPFLTEDEQKLLKAHPELAAVALKLEGDFIPKGRFDEVNNKQKELSDQLQKIQTDREAAERKSLEEQGKHKELAEQRAKQLLETEEKLKLEKADADKYRKTITDKREYLKGRFADKWLSVYDQASLDDLLKLETIFDGENESPDKHRPGNHHRPEKTTVDKMESKDFNKMVDEVKAGKKFELTKQT